MLGLMKKDLLMIKCNLKLIVIMFIAFTFMTLNNNMNMFFMPSFISVIVFISTFSYDEYNNWNSYLVTLPNGRKRVVISKYVTSFFLCLLSILITIILSVIIGILNNKLDLEIILSGMIGCFFSLVVLQAIMYPFIFKYGVEKARIGIFVGVFSISIISGLISKQIDIVVCKSIISFFNQYYMLIIPFASLIILLISYEISKKIYENKEF